MNRRSLRSSFHGAARRSGSLPECSMTRFGSHSALCKSTSTVDVCSLASRLIGCPSLSAAEDDVWAVHSRNALKRVSRGAKGRFKLRTTRYLREAAVIRDERFRCFSSMHEHGLGAHQSADRHDEPGSSTSTWSECPTTPRPPPCRWSGRRAGARGLWRERE